MIEEEESFYGGKILGTAWITDMDDSYMSDIVTGFRVSESVIEALVDENVETLVFVDDGRGRYTSSIEDWQDYAVADGDFRHLRQSRMSRG